MKSSKLFKLGEGVVEQKIFLIRGKKVMIDRDLAELYDVETKYLNRQVKRNRRRFPEEFIFQLTVREKNELVTNWHRFESLKHSKFLPFAFTEHGVAMLASVLNSERAIQVSIYIIKTFMKLRALLSTHKKLAYKLLRLEKKIKSHDESIGLLFQAIRELMVEPESPKPMIGFHPIR